jgi:hypothetical protein
MGFQQKQQQQIRLHGSVIHREKFSHFLGCIIIGEGWIWRDLEGNVCQVTEVLYWRFTGGREENHDNDQWR